MAVLRAIADRQELRFLVVGGGVSLAFLLMSWGFAAAGAPPFAGTVTAYAIAFLGAYLLQRNWTFRASDSHGRSFPRYLAAQIVCAGLAGCVAHVATALFAAPPFWMAVAGTGTAAATSYVLTSLWVFPKASRPD